MSRIISNRSINNNWKSDSVNFGTRESIFDQYYIYQDEGIKVRNISGKIFNIIFMSNYNQNVVEGIFPGVDFQTIESIATSKAMTQLIEQDPESARRDICHFAENILSDKEKTIIDKHSRKCRNYRLWCFRGM